MLQVELVYSTGDQTLIQLDLILGNNSTVADALAQSGILREYPETENLSFGIFSRPVDKQQQLKDGDRLEIYRPLTANPMEKRRQRAKAKKRLGRVRKML